MESCENVEKFHAKTQPGCFLVLAVNFSLRDNRINGTCNAPLRIAAALSLDDFLRTFERGAAFDYNAYSDDVLGRLYYRDCAGSKVRVQFGGKVMTEETVKNEYAAWIGIDWADEEHAVCLRPAGSDKTEHSQVKQKPEVIQEWIHQLRNRFHGGKIAVALEQSRGALIYMLMNFDFLVLFPVNPKTLKKYREALRSSGAKDDPADAELLLDFLQTHLKRLRPWKPEDEQTRKLRMLVEFRRKVVDEGSSLSRQMEQYLKGYFPQALEWITDLKTVMACDFLMKWPSLQALKKAKPAQLRKFYRKHNCRNNEVIERRISEILPAVALTHDEAIISASVLMIQAQVSQLRELLAAVERFDKQIQNTFESYPDRFLYESLPAAGPVLEPRLAVAMGLDRDRYQDAIQLQQFSGTAPVTNTSGKKRWVHWRWACPKFVRQTFHEFAGCSIPVSLWAKAYYQQQRAKGKDHHAALRSLSFKWQRIIFRCWKDGKPYDEKKYLEVLKRRNSPLVKLLNLPKPPKAPKSSHSSWTNAGEIITELRQNFVKNNVEKPKKEHKNIEKNT